MEKGIEIIMVFENSQEALESFPAGTFLTWKQLQETSGLTKGTDALKFWLPQIEEGKLKKLCVNGWIRTTDFPFDEYLQVLPKGKLFTSAVASKLWEVKPGVARGILKYLGALHKLRFKRQNGHRGFAQWWRIDGENASIRELTCHHCGGTGKEPGL